MGCMLHSEPSDPSHVNDSLFENEYGAQIAPSGPDEPWKPFCFEARRLERLELTPTSSNRPTNSNNRGERLPIKSV
jgi:hypothetical protein